MAGLAYTSTATLHWLQGRTLEATRLPEHALEAFRRGGDDDRIAWTLMCLALDP